MNLYPWLGRLIVKETQPPGLIATQVMVDHAPGGETEWVIPSRFFGRRRIGNGKHPGLAIRVTKTLGKEPRRAGVIERWTGPEDATLLVYFLPRNAVIIGDASLRSDAVFIPDI